MAQWKTLKKRYLEFFENGIDTNLFSNLVYKETFYRHGNLCDLKICAFNELKNEIEVPSKELIDILKLWDIHRHYKGLFAITYDIDNNEVVLKADVSSSLKYTCNSRVILKQLRDVGTYIQAARIMLNTKHILRYREIPIHLLLTAVLNNNNTAFKLLAPYKTSSIIKMLSSAKFKHIYKLVHPDTIFHK